MSGVLFVVGLAVAPEAHAHAKLIRSQPEPFEAVGAPPAEVRLWFNERLEDEFNAIEVVGPGGHHVEQGAARVNPRDRTNLVVRLGGLPPGSYVIHWRILSLDGHPARGRLMFTVKERSP